ncbi:MAG: signal-transduction protein [Thermoleophilia bacterium]|nr:signal-transduction protein [Thermoleophilia bacterium]
MPRSARDIMTADPVWIDASETIDVAARQLADEHVGAIPICENGKLRGMLTDRDIVVKVIAEGKDPHSVTAGELAQGEAITIGADDTVDEVVRVMRKHDVRRLPVIDGRELVGIVAQADVATELGATMAGELLVDISSAPANA